MWGMNSNLFDKTDVDQKTVPPLKLSIQSRSHESVTAHHMKDDHAAPPLLDPGYSNRPRQTRGTAALAHEAHDLADAVNTAYVSGNVVQSANTTMNMNAIATDAINWHTSAKSENYSDIDAFYGHPTFTREKKVIRVLGSQENEHRNGTRLHPIEESPRNYDASPVPMLGGAGSRPVRTTSPARRPTQTARPSVHRHTDQESKTVNHVHKHTHYHVLGNAANGTSQVINVPQLQAQTQVIQVPVPSQKIVVPVQSQQQPVTLAVQQPTVQTFQLQQQPGTTTFQLVPTKAAEGATTVQQPTVQTFTVQQPGGVQVVQTAKPNVQTVVQQVPVQVQVEQPKVYQIQVPVQGGSVQTVTVPERQTVQTITVPQQQTVQTITTMPSGQVQTFTIPQQQQQVQTVAVPQQQVQTITIPQQQQQYQTITVPQQQQVQTIAVQQPMQQVVQTVQQQQPRQQVTGLHTLHVSVPVIEDFDGNVRSIKTASARAQVPVVVSFPGQAPVQTVGVYGYQPMQQQQQATQQAPASFPGYPQPGYPQPGYPQPGPGYGAGYPQPGPGYGAGYPQPGFGYGYPGGGYGYPAYGKAKKEGKDKKDKKGRKK